MPVGIPGGAAARGHRAQRLPGTLVAAAGQHGDQQRDGVGEGLVVEAASAALDGLPPFYFLHAWVWKHNPAGAFAIWNPRVNCTADHAS